jgi:hypothetical protein
MSQRPFLDINFQLRLYWDTPREKKKPKKNNKGVYPKRVWEVVGDNSDLKNSYFVQVEM